MQHLEFYSYKFIAEFMLQELYNMFNLDCKLGVNESHVYKTNNC